MIPKTNKVAVVTGAAGGIGQCVTSLLLEQGYTIAMLDNNKAGMDQVFSCLRHYQKKLKHYAIDVTSEHQVSTAMTMIMEDLGSLDVLINNAGILRDGLLVKIKDDSVNKLPLSAWQSVIDINLTGVFLCGREAATHMATSGQGGIIINMTSLARNGNFGQSSYAASKAGVEALTVTWAMELSRFNIRVAGIAPGVIHSPMTESMKPEAIQSLCKRIPVGRTGNAEEVAKAVSFIIDNSYFNGRILELDGGLRF